MALYHQIDPTEVVLYGGLVAGIIWYLIHRAEQLDDADEIVEAPLECHNPGNIRYNPRNKWSGQIGAKNGFVCFLNENYGIQAVLKLIYNYKKIYGINTVAGIITRYAPPNENDTANYMDFVSREASVAMHDPIRTTKQLLLVVRAMLKIESGTVVTTQRLEAQRKAARLPSWQHVQSA